MLYYNAMLMFSIYFPAVKYNSNRFKICLYSENNKYLNKSIQIYVILEELLSK